MLKTSVLIYASEPLLGWPYKLNQLDQNLDPSSSCKCKKTLNWFWTKYFKRTKLNTLTVNLLIAKGDGYSVVLTAD